MPPRSRADYDVVVIGGGPAGLAAALWLARYRISTILVDSGNPRNAPTWAVHGYLGLPDPLPMELRRLGRDQAKAAGAKIISGTVASVEGAKDDFGVKLKGNRHINTRRVLFATGLRDIIPEIPGLLDFYGTSIWHCPDCDGPSVPDLNIGVIGWGRQIAAFCMEMLSWTSKLTILTHGHKPNLPIRSRDALRRFDIGMRAETIMSIEGTKGTLDRVVFEDGSSQKFEALFFHIAFGPGCSIPAELGCKADAGGILKVSKEFETTVPGVYAAGDITPGSKLAIRAAADGTRAAVGIYRSLMPEERKV